MVLRTSAKTRAFSTQAVTSDIASDTGCGARAAGAVRRRAAGGAVGGFGGARRRRANSVSVVGETSTV